MYNSDDLDHTYLLLVKALSRYSFMVFYNMEVNYTHIYFYHSHKIYSIQIPGKNNTDE